ncbi:hypothetical protein [Clostridium sp. 001]|uniref:hypothetical protein n=1 Tax=Clostridium sp. 001 TaxID=1970093 RepID=UPI001C2BAFA8|nr:hypothetical protein [Clostridium sp. 001]QXE17646.1 hypothetical protein B5S50_01605 [Clostridium sp. 001]
MESVELIEDLIEKSRKLQYHDSSALDALKRRAKMIIENVFGESSKYLDNLNNLRFHPLMYPASEEYQRSSWEDGQNELMKQDESSDITYAIILLSGDDKWMH